MVVVIVVGIGFYGEACGLEDSEVVGPCGVGDEDGICDFIPHEFRADSECASATYGLEADDFAVIDAGFVGSEEEAEEGIVHGGEAIDGEVFFGRFFFIDPGFCFADGAEDLRFSLGIAVGADAEVDLVGSGIVFEVDGEVEDRIWGSKLHAVKPRHSSTFDFGIRVILWNGQCSRKGDRREEVDENFVNRVELRQVFGALAQLVECNNGIVEVIGSTPIRSIGNKKGADFVRAFFV